MIRKILLITGIILGLVAGGAAIWFYGFVNPRHYNTADFDNLAELQVAAAMLRASGSRGVLPEKDWPAIFRDTDAQEIRVYPTGVLLKLHGVFTLESGLYFPAPRVEENLETLTQDTGEEPIYIKLASGVYSYRTVG